MEKFKEIFEEIYDKIYKASRKFDGINEAILQKTGIKIDVGMILFTILFIFIIILFVKAILGFVLNALITGDY